MRIGIVTFVKADNYGAEFQAYALQQKLNTMGYDAEVLDLEKEKGVMASSKRNIIMSLKKRIAYYGLIKGTIKFVQTLIDALEAKKAKQKNIEQAIAKHKIFERFFYEKIKHSKDYIQLDELSSKELPYDVYIAGSDQIWNYMQTKRLDVFFLMFANRFKAKKISYAASFSVPSIPYDLKEQYKAYLENLDSISVREDNAVTLVKELSGKNAVQVLDPTLLLTREEWIKNLALKDCFNNSKKIVLIYTLSGSRYIYTLAKKIAKKLNADVVNIKSGYKRVKEDSGIIHVTDAGPQEFITLFSKAVYVITDSFHGTAFSINFNIPFTSLLNPVSNINSRVLSILELCGLQDRLIYDDGSRSEPKDLSVSFETANKAISDARKLSLSYIEDSLGLCN